MALAFKVVIPARYGSTRLPGKPLRLIAGKPMIEHVCQRALAADAEQVVVATDDQRIFEQMRKLGIDTVMTRVDHNSGTERIAEVAQHYGWCDSDIIVNLQGDEPLIPSDYIRKSAEILASQQSAGIATLATPINKVALAEIFSPNAVKVVLNKMGYALYFSRAAIPWDRKLFPQSPSVVANADQYLRHIGIYAYTVGFLQRYINWSVSALEQIECLEQLRILWHGEAIIVATVASAPDAGVDTEQDLQRVEQILLNCK